jgi:hypothetical protein
MVPPEIYLRHFERLAIGGDLYPFCESFPLQFLSEIVACEEAVVDG